MTNEFGIGTVYEYLNNKGHRVIHIETCGPDNYIIYSKPDDADFGIMHVMSRESMRDMCLALMAHMAFMEKREAEE